MSRPAPHSTIRLLALLCAFGLASTAPAPAASIERGPRPHADGPDAAASPLDLREVTFGQRGTELVLRMTTAGEWKPEDLLAAAGRSLCVKLYYGKLPTPRARVCVVAKGTFPALRYIRMDPFGQDFLVRPLAATVTRPDTRSVHATFAPISAELNQGRYSWQAESRWTCDVPAGCVDTAPTNGNVIARIRPLTEPRCFGAAARNPNRRCRNAALRLAVVPSPAAAILAPNARCAIVQIQTPYTCEFGARREVAVRRVALIGDSHATHWRGALEVLTQANRWRAASITRSGCPLSTAAPKLARERRSSCRRWNKAVRRWLELSPGVRTVFVSQLAGLDVLPSGGRSAFETQIVGYIHAWQRLPRSVRRIVVIRDTPKGTDNAPLCVQRAMNARRQPGYACAVSRSYAVARDPAVIAAQRMRSRRVRVVDLTSFMCSSRLCYPVVGGALVHKDKTHLTDTFAATLGPFLLRRVNRILRG